MISNIRRGIMGTVEFDGKFSGMRKPQDFIVYPIAASDNKLRIKVQSDTRIGVIYLATGEVRMSASRPGGAFFHHIPHDGPPTDRLSAKDVLLLKAALLCTAGASVGSSVVKTDNSGAAGVFGGVMS